LEFPSLTTGGSVSITPRDGNPFPKNTVSSPSPPVALALTLRSVAFGVVASLTVNGQSS